MASDFGAIVKDFWTFCLENLAKEQFSKIDQRKIALAVKNFFALSVQKIARFLFRFFINQPYLVHAFNRAISQ